MRCPPSECVFVAGEPGVLFRCIEAPEHSVAVRKAAEAMDDVVMMPRPIGRIVAERREQPHAVRLIGQVFGMLEWQIEKAALDGPDLLVETARYCCTGD